MKAVTARASLAGSTTCGALRPELAATQQGVYDGGRGGLYTAVSPRVRQDDTAGWRCSV